MSERIGFVVRRGHFGGVSKGDVPEWSAHAPGYLHAEFHPVCLVVTGDIVEADRVLSAAQAAAEAEEKSVDVSEAKVEAVARALFVRDYRGTAQEFDALNDAGLHARYWNDARAVLEAAEVES